MAQDWVQQRKDRYDELTLWQRMALRRIRRRAGRRPGEPLSSEDWPIIWALDHSLGNRAVQRVFRSLPTSPRCGMCSAPFAGAGRFVTRPLGHRPSRKNPHICATCVELAPPGGTTMPVGIFFADIRGFTAAAEDADPEVTSRTLRQFYGCAEDVLFPEAIIDKMIGDEVMALYLTALVPEGDVPGIMCDHARRLLQAVGYGSAGGPFVEVGIGLDFGEAFVGNIGDRAVFDFTAVGDVVNTASRLQAVAAGGEVVASLRVAEALPPDQCEPFEVALKGKRQPETAYRLRTTTTPT